ncbi:site-specific DNA-methyltransferase [Mycoplasmopsis synoviae]|uniref:site-specific DNA-methyltransferase n=1 Tax=Mycoplasmopsis synoviae TaxID=2109 RepID=UPI00356905EA
MYIDPPYNTESAFADGNSVSNNNELISASKFIYRDKFSRNGWLNMMHERLQLAKKLLKETGIIFVSIDDNEQAYLKVLMDEIFGEENFIANISWIKKRGPGSNTSFINKVVKNCEYILMYAKNYNKDTQIGYKIHDLEKLKKLGYTNKDEFFEERGFYKLTDLHRPSSSGAFRYSKSLNYLIEAPDGTKFELYSNILKPESACYTWSEDSFNVGNKLGFIEIKKNPKGYWQAYRKQYQFVKFDPKEKSIVEVVAGQEFENYIENIYNQNGGKEIIEIFENKNVFDFPKPLDLIKYLLSFSNNKNARVLDFFAGSGTTGHAVEDLNKQDGGNRTYTLVTNNENNIGYSVTYERLFRVNFGKSTNGSSFKWVENNNVYKSNLDVFEVKYESININDSRNVDQIVNKVSKMLFDFGINKTVEYKKILNGLSSLKKLKSD